MLPPLRFWRSAKAEASQKRESTFESVVNAYSGAFVPGATRRDVESYLRERSIPFTKMCCLDAERYVAILVKIGEEERPGRCADRPRK